MFCNKCGAEISDDAAFCSKCGAQTKASAGEVKMPKEQKTEPKKVGTQKKAVVMGTAGLIAVLLIAGIFLLLRPKTLKVDLGNYVTVSWEGLSTEGTARVQFRESALVQDLTTEKELSALQSSAISKLLGEVSQPFVLSKWTGLANGDEVELTCNIPEDLLKGEHIALTFEKRSFTIDNLMEIRQISFADYAEVEFRGYDGYGYASIVVDFEAMANRVEELILEVDDSETAKTYIEENKERLVYSAMYSQNLDVSTGLSNGDKVQASITIDDDRKRLDVYGLEFTGMEQEYEVSGLGTFDSVALIDYITVDFQGYDGIGTASWQIDSTALTAAAEALGERAGYSVETVAADLEWLIRVSDVSLSASEGLSNEDAIIVTLTLTEEQQTMKHYGLTLPGGEKTVTVAGLTPFIEIPVASCIEIDVEGYDGAGYQSWSINDETLLNLVSEAVGKDRDPEAIPEIAKQIRYALTNGSLLADSSTALKNEDVLNYTVTAVDNASLQAYGIRVPEEAISLTVSTLKTPKEADLTELLTVSVSGIVPNVYVEVTTDASHPLYNCLNWNEMEAFPERLQAENGDTFTIELKYYADQALSQGYLVTNTSKTVTIEGLPTYAYNFTLEEGSQIPALTEQKKKDIHDSILQNRDSAREYLGTELKQIYWNLSQTQLLEAVRWYTDDIQKGFSKSVFLFETMVPVLTQDEVLETRSIYTSAYADNIVENTDLTLYWEYSYSGSWYSTPEEARAAVETELTNCCSEWEAIQKDTIENTAAAEIRDGLATDIAVQPDIYTSGEKVEYFIPDVKAEDAAADVVYEGHHYYLFEGACTWEEAAAFCKKAGGHLATITNSIEQNVIYHALLKNSGANACWIGYTDVDTTGSWYWCTQESSTYTNWIDGEPNNSEGIQHYAGMHKDRDGRWDDKANDSTAIDGFIMEIESDLSDSSEVLIDMEELVEQNNIGKWSTLSNSYGGTAYSVLAIDASENAWARYYLGGQYKKLQGTLSVYSEADNGVSMDLLIYGDGNLLLKKTGMNRQTKPILFELDLTGVDCLEIYSRNTGSYSNGFILLEEGRMYPAADAAYQTAKTEKLQEAIPVMAEWTYSDAVMQDAMGFLYGGYRSIPVYGEEISTAVWNLEEKYQKLDAILTTTADFDYASEAEISIYGDDNLLYQGILSFAEPKQEISLDVSGVQTLRMESRNRASGNSVWVYMVQDRLEKTEAVYEAENTEVTIQKSGYQPPQVTKKGLRSLMAAEIFEGHGYYLIGETMTWAEAKEYCEKQGGHLAVINSIEEQLHLQRLIQKAKPDLHLWLGANDELIDGLWETVTGEELTQTFWASGQPDNVNDNESYLVMDKNQLAWHDYSADLEFYPVLEFSQDETNTELVRLSTIDDKLSESYAYEAANQLYDVNGNLKIASHEMDARDQALARYELEGRYETFSGMIGAVWGSSSDRRVDIAIYGDGKLLFAERNYRACEKPLAFSVDTTGVMQLTIRSCPTIGYDGCGLVLYDEYLKKAKKVEKTERPERLVDLQVVEYVDAETINTLSPDTYGTPHDGALCVYTNGNITYLVDGDCQSISFLTGPGKGTSNDNSITLRVYADNELIYEESSITKTSQPIPVELELAGKDLIRFEAVDENNVGGWLYIFDAVVKRAE